MFDRITRFVARQTGRPVYFVLSLLGCTVWFATGPWFHWSDTWQLLINTPTTILTFLNTVLQQADSNRNWLAFHAKQDAVIAAFKEASNRFIRIEEKTEQEIEQFRSDLPLSDQ